LLGAYLSLLQIFVFSGWGWMVFDLSYSKGSLAGPTFYAGSFVLISIFLMALIGGLEWEVFQVGTLSIII
jgi:two pore calcium channel protein 1/two pore calcium channel protein 3